MKIIEIKEHWYNQNIDNYFPNRHVKLMNININIKWYADRNIKSTVDEIVDMCVFRQIKIHYNRY